MPELFNLSGENGESGKMFEVKAAVLPKVFGARAVIEMVQGRRRQPITPAFLLRL
jgi:hypothetical protein